MHLFLQLLLATTLFSSFIFLVQRTRRHGNKLVHPPGPPRYPLIGNLGGFVSACPHLYLHELSKKYGPLMYLRLGFVPTVVISSARMAKEVLKTHDHAFCSRPALAANRKLSYNGSDIAFAPYGDSWREIKRACVLNFFCTKRVESFSSIREEEVGLMIQRISELSNEGKLVDLSEMMMCLTSTIVCRSAFRRRYSSLSVVEILREAQHLLATFCFSDYFPFLGWIDKLTGMSARLDKVFMELDGFYEEIIDDHLKNNIATSGQEDIVDVLLKLREENSLGIDFTMDHIKGVLMNIFVAGTDTSAATLVWAMTELMKNPECMKRLKEESEALMMNKDRNIIKEEDLKELTYLKAVLKETMRLHPASPLLAPRETTQKCNIQGYEIQEKALVFVNVWAIGRDPEWWENPEEFKPERFLGDRSVDFKGQHFELVPFGSGRRICPGIQMSAAILELALANLVYMFEWKLPVGMEDQVMDMAVLQGITPHKEKPLCLLAKLAC